MRSLADSGVLRVNRGRHSPRLTELPGAPDATNRLVDGHGPHPPWTALMPRNPFNLSFVGDPAHAPAYFPWKSMDDPDRNMVWERRITQHHSRTLQQIAKCCQTWAAWYRKCGPESKMLAASTLSIERLGAFLEGLTDAMLDAAPLHGDKRLEIRDVKRNLDPRAHLSAILEAVQAVRAVVAGQYDVDVTPPINWFSRPHYSSAWREGTAYEYGLVARAVPADFPYVLSDIKSLPSDIRLTARLKDAARQVCGDLKTTVRAAASGNPSAATTEHTLVRRALIELQTTATIKHASWSQWCKAAENVHSAIAAWMQQSWTNAHGNSTNQDLRRQLLIDVAYLRQYALLMRAADRRHRILLRLEAVVALAREAGKYAAKIIGADDESPPPKLSKLFKLDLVESEFREQWAALPLPLQKKAEQLSTIVMKDGKRQPWLVSNHMDAFIHRGFVGGEDAATQRRRLVNEVLAPMQAVGLAAKVKWSDLLAVPPLKRSKTGKRREPDWAAKMSDGYRGRLWVVNPFGKTL